jgi:hypothetical protein
MFRASQDCNLGKWGLAVYRVSLAILISGLTFFKKFLFRRKMVTQVQNKKLYHVTMTKPYKQAFTLNQSVITDAGHNPFFGFYENSRTYPVTQLDGSVQQIRAVDFLKRVRDGQIQAPQLAVIATEVAQHYVMLCRELIMEDIRRSEFGGEPPSRQSCLYVCETLAEARYWNQRLAENGDICELTCTGNIHRVDARLLLGDSEPLSVTKDRARQYWRGDVSDNPEFETLFSGSATVTALGL